MIFETKEEIDLLIKHLDKKVLELKNINPKHELLGRIRVFYNKIIIPYIESYNLDKKKFKD